MTRKQDPGSSAAVVGMAGLSESRCLDARRAASESLVSVPLSRLNRRGGARGGARGAGGGGKGWP